MKKIFYCLLVVSLLKMPAALASFDPLRDPSVPQTQSEKIKTTSQRAPSSLIQNRNRRITSGVRLRSTTIQTNTTQNQNQTTVFTSKSEFSLALPNLFQVISDDLTNEEGAYILSDTKTIVRVEPTHETCLMNIIGLRNCLEERLRDIHKKKTENYKNLKRQDKREFVLDQDEATKQSTNIALWSLSQVGTDKIGVLVFIEKNSKKVWTITIEGESTDDFLKQPRYLLSLAQSLAHKEKENKFGSYENNLTPKVTRPLEIQQGFRTSRNMIIRGQGNQRLNGLNSYTSQDGSLSINLPSNYTISVDTLGEENGKFEFKKEDQSLVFMSLPEICPVKKERSIYQACIEKISETLKQDFQKQFPDVKILKEENKNLNLENGKHADDIVRIVHWFDRSKRYAQIVLVHPKTNQVVFARMYGTDKRNEILTDVRLLENVLRSLRLK